MDRGSKINKKPVSEQIIFRNMMIAVFSVASIFFLKNLINQAWRGAIVIGICLVVFTIVVLVMKKVNAKQDKQQFAICISVVFVVFCISINSGAYYSDDFPLYLAVIGISGLYLMPKYALVQMVLIDIMLVIAYILHPEKADPLGQYIMCIALFSVGAFTIYMVIKRGRSYIEISKERAEEAETLLAEMRKAGEELKQNCDTSSRGIENLEEANERLEACADAVKSGSESITRGTVEVAQTFEDVQEKVQETERKIDSLNGEVKKVEASLADNKKNMNEMTNKMEDLQNTIKMASQVFSLLQGEIQEISQVTEELTQIASSTNMLALNASIEAARAGQAGAGFAVVASKVQELAEDSNNCSAKVVSVVGTMEKRIEETTTQLTDSTEAIRDSIETLQGFADNFDNLTGHFGSLYQDIEEQNTNIQQVESIFEDLKHKISEMTELSEENQNSVVSITDTINVYKENMEMVIDDNKNINEVSKAMLELADTQDMP